MRATECRICRNEDLDVILDYGDVALSDSFLNNPDEIKDEGKYPLRLCFCNSCKHLQIDEIVDPRLLFQNYVYETGVSKSVVGFAQDLSQTLLECHHAIGSGDQPKVLEVASNDGTVLSIFQEKGCEILGIDPAQNIVEAANSRGVRSIARFFNLESAQAIASEYGQWDMCIARNVMAHVNDLHGFAEGIKVVLAATGFAVVEVPHIQTMFEELQYDQVFHEHIGYHSLDSFQKLFGLFEMEVFDVEKIWIHGGSIRVYLQHNNGPRELSARVHEVLSEEESLGLYDQASWNAFAEKILGQKAALREEIAKLKKEGKKVAVYGASGKGQSLLQFCELDGDCLDYVVDKSEMKQGKITPGTHIQIYSTDHIYEDLPDVILLCAWNFAEEIVKQESRFVSLGGKFLHPLPMPHFLT